MGGQSLQFVALDFETATHAPISACELGMVRCEGDRIADEKSFLIRPPSRDFTFTYLHGISWTDVKDQSCFADHWLGVDEFIQDADFLVAHNAPFDRGVLSACCRHHGIGLPRQPFLCTVQIARKVWSIYPTKLPDVCRSLAIPLGRHHRAMDDARACARIVHSALQTLGDSRFCETFLPKRHRPRLVLDRRSSVAASPPRKFRASTAPKYRERTKALGDWGEKKAAKLLRQLGFRDVRNMNEDVANHPFADIYAENARGRFLISVRTRNKLTARGNLNSTYNVCKKGNDLHELARRYDAELAWIAVQIDAEAQRYSAYFGLLADLNTDGQQYSIPMSRHRLVSYECLADNELDASIKPEWTNRNPTIMETAKRNREPPPASP